MPVEGEKRKSIHVDVNTHSRLKKILRDRNIDNERRNRKYEKLGSVISEALDALDGREQTDNDNDAIG